MSNQNARAAATLRDLQHLTASGRYDAVYVEQSTIDLLEETARACSRTYETDIDRAKPFKMNGIPVKPIQIC
jgi:hypothetical protein